MFKGWGDVYLMAGGAAAVISRMKDHWTASRPDGSGEEPGDARVPA
jgi:hypothetical protein